MNITKEGYILSRNIIKVTGNKNTVREFIKNNKIKIGVISFFTILILIEAILISKFMELLLALSI